MTTAEKLYSEALSNLETGASTLVSAARKPTRAAIKRALEHATAAHAQLQTLENIAAGNTLPKVGE